MLQLVWDFHVGGLAQKKWLRKLRVRVRSLISYHGEDSSDRAGKGGGMKASSERIWGPVQSTGCLQGHSVPSSPAWHAAGALALSVQGLRVKGRSCERRAVLL